MAHKKDILNIYAKEVESIKEAGLFKGEAPFVSPQGARVRMEDGRELLCMCANNYLGLGNNQRLIDAAKRTYDEKGYGLASVRFICGTQDIHKTLEQKISGFLGTDDTILYSSCFDANGGLFETLLTAEDAVISDELNHASIIDGCRQSRAETVVYRHNDMADLERKIRERPGRQGLIVSDGVFSMDGDMVDLPGLVELADAYGLLSMIDEAHATGVVGATGRGCEEHFHMEGRTDILMGTLSKAIGAEGGYVCGSRILAQYLKNRARSYIFSTSLSPVTMAAAKRALELIEEEPWRVGRLQENIRWFCGQLRERGIETDSETAIIPIRIGAEEKALKVSGMLMERGFFIPAIRYPTVKKGEAMLRAALMATHTKEELSSAAAAIAETVAAAGLEG